jgi:hypothetical protein
VKANRGAAGVDGESLEAFEKDLKRNLYKIWNRMSSGSYFPPPVRLVEIPKASGGTRGLGIPTVADRIAQTVVTMVLEPEVEPRFHPDSYGYRPGRSARSSEDGATTIGTPHRPRGPSADWRPKPGGPTPTISPGNTDAVSASCCKAKHGLVAMRWWRPKGVAGKPSDFGLAIEICSWIFWPQRRRVSIRSHAIRIGRWI